MAKAIKKSGLAAKLGNAGAKAVEAHRDDEVKYNSAGALPPGIEGGVAQLIECKFDTYKNGDNTGEYYFQARGIVKAPKKHPTTGAFIEGLQTMIMEPVCETPGRSRESIEDHIAWVIQAMKKLGADTEGAEIGDLEALAAGLKEEKPYFQFRTWQGEATKEWPNPKVNHDWGRMIDPADLDDSVTTTEEAVEDETEEEEDTEEEETEEAEEEEETEEEENEEEEEEAEAEEEAIDWLPLGKKADKGDVKVQKQVQTAAEEAGLDPDDYDTWVDLAKALMAASESNEEEEEEEAEEETAEPAVEDVVKFKPPKAKKAVECVVMAVNKKAKTVKLKDLNDNKIYKDISWDDIEMD